MCYRFPHFSHAILFHICFHTNFFTVFSQFTPCYCFPHIFHTFSQYSFPHFSHTFLTVFISTLFPLSSFHQFSTIFHNFPMLFFPHLFHTFLTIFFSHIFSTVSPHNSFFHTFPTLPYPHSKFNIFCGIFFSFIKIRLQQIINIPSNFSFSFMFLCLMASLSNIP
jgi:hypothetical protein